MTSQACLIRLECGCLIVWSRLGRSFVARPVGVDGLQCPHAKPLYERPHTGPVQVGVQKAFLHHEEDDNNGSDNTRIDFPPATQT